jgi:predicted DCC family thiol-disulfide oxidoreductase YuxK
LAIRISPEVVLDWMGPLKHPIDDRFYSCAFYLNWHFFNSSSTHSNLNYVEKLMLNFKI